MRITIILLVICVSALVVCGCSDVNPGLPSISDNGFDQPPGDGHGRISFGQYTVHLDPQSNSGYVTPSRESASHLNIEGYLTKWPCVNCFKVENLKFLPGNQVECDIILTFPLVDPVFTVFDVKVIAVFPADEYFYGTGISYALENRDGLTAILDHPSIPGTINGYKAYNKSDERRSFGPGDVLIEHFLVKLPDEPFGFDIAIDANWGPNDGINFPIENNCPEVRELAAFVLGSLNSQGGSGELNAIMYDYQGTDTIWAVIAYCEQLFNNPIRLEFSYGDGHFAVYDATISNEKLANPGFYNIAIKASDVENANYSYDVSSYFVLPVEVETGDVEITLNEDKNYKTPGNIYDFLSYSGAADHNLIDYFDHNGPWDFRNLHFTSTATRSILPVNDPEVALFGSDFPSAVHYVKNSGNFGFSDGLYFQPEKYDFSKNLLVPLGFYEEEHFLGSVVFQGTNGGFPYPVNVNTAYKTIFHSGTYFNVEYDVKALGLGICTIPLAGGTSKLSLLVRTRIEASFIYPIITAILYEWYDDSGNLLALVCAANVAGENPNWNEDTNEIVYGGVLALEQSNRE
jgi:hypothetical protein